MKLNEFLSSLTNYKNGTYRHIEWERVITLKDGSKVIKHSSTVGRLGINYGNLPSVKNRPADNSTKTNYVPTEWLVKNVVKVTSTGKNVVMIYTNKNDNIKTKVNYFTEDGTPVKKEDIIDKMYAKDKGSSNQVVELFTVNIEDITTI